MKNENLKSNRTEAMELMSIISTVKLVQDKDNKVYAILPSINPSSQAISIHSAEFETWICKKLYDTHHRFPQQNNLKGAIALAGIQNKHLGEVFLRFGHHNHDNFIDMCNDKNEVVAISTTGWHITSSPPIYFRRFYTQRPLTRPTKNGNFLNITKYMNIEHEEDKILTLTTMCSFVFANVARPILGLVGDAGSAKSTTARIFRMLLDPVNPLENNIPFKINDFNLVIYNNALPIFDNIQNIDKKVSDMLCTMVTGSGQQSRLLFKDNELNTTSYKQGCIFTSLSMPTNAFDFNDRAVIIELCRLKGSARKSEEDLMAQFKEDMPSILGGMLDVLVEAKKLASKITLGWSHRLVGMFKIGAAVAEVLGFGANRYAEALKENIESHTTASKIQKQNEPVIDALQSLVAEKSTFSGSTTMLLKELSSISGGSFTQRNGWPSSPEKLGKALARVAASIEDRGILMNKKTTNKGTVVTVSKHVINSETQETTNSLSQCPPTNMLTQDSKTQNYPESEKKECAQVSDPLDEILKRLENLESKNEVLEDKQDIQTDSCMYLQIDNQKMVCLLSGELIYDTSSYCFACVHKMSKSELKDTETNSNEEEYSADGDFQNEDEWVYKSVFDD